MKHFKMAIEQVQPTETQSYQKLSAKFQRAVLTDHGRPRTSATKPVAQGLKFCLAITIFILTSMYKSQKLWLYITPKTWLLVKKKVLVVLLCYLLRCLLDLFICYTICCLSLFFTSDIVYLSTNAFVFLLFYFF